MRRLILLLVVIISGCAHSPKCGNPTGARVILAGTESCQVRIRQVTVGSELKIPQSLKGASLSEFTLDWVEPQLENGKIELGHFVLTPAAKEGQK